ncbi:hypothetical protein GCM10017784_19820 [Deinococcus indicus]|nr:hypothetical protein GCM10017784_19820 [Deinococcus indicus]
MRPILVQRLRCPHGLRRQEIQTARPQLTHCWIWSGIVAPMRILRLPDEHLADLIADGSTVIITLRWHTRTPAPGDLVHLDTLGHWRVLEILRRERPGFGADLRASLLAHSDA